MRKLGGKQLSEIEDQRTALATCLNSEIMLMLMIRELCLPVLVVGAGNVRTSAAGLHDIGSAS